MNLTSEISKLPRTSAKEIVDAFRNECDHQYEIRNGQVHNEHICRCPECWKASEDPQNHPVTTNGNYSFNKIFVA